MCWNFTCSVVQPALVLRFCGLQDLRYIEFEVCLALEGDSSGVLELLLQNDRSYKAAQGSLPIIWCVFDRFYR